GCPLSARVYYAHHGNTYCRLNVVECQRRGRVACDHQHFNAMFFKKMRRGNRVLCHGADGFSAIRKMRGIAEVEIIRRWERFAQFPQNREASKPGVKNSNHRRHAYSNSFASSCTAAV